jgi:hypothetical protein
MAIEPGKSYQSKRNQWYRVLKIEGGKVFASLGGLVIPYELDQFVRMVTR